MRKPFSQPCFPSCFEYCVFLWTRHLERSSYHSVILAVKGLREGGIKCQTRQKYFLNISILVNFLNILLEYRYSCYHIFNILLEYRYTCYQHFKTLLEYRCTCHHIFNILLECQYTCHYIFLLLFKYQHTSYCICDALVQISTYFYIFIFTYFLWIEKIFTYLLL